MEQPSPRLCLGWQLRKEFTAANIISLSPCLKETRQFPDNFTEKKILSPPSPDVKPWVSAGPFLPSPGAVLLPHARLTRRLYLNFQEELLCDYGSI